MLAQITEAADAVKKLTDQTFSNGFNWWMTAIAGGLSLVLGWFIYREVRKSDEREETVMKLTAAEGVTVDRYERLAKDILELLKELKELILKILSK
jgi:hypothetical protein